MDNYRRPMYNRYNRNMGFNQNAPCNCAKPIVDTRHDDHCDHHDDHCDHHDAHCDHHEDHCDHHEDHCEHHEDHCEHHDNHCETHHEDHCEHHDHHEHCIDEMPLAMAYVPMQKWKCVTDAATGLEMGTIFQELVLPFYGDRNGCGMRGDRS